MTKITRFFDRMIRMFVATFLFVLLAIFLDGVTNSNGYSSLGMTKVKWLSMSSATITIFILVSIIFFLFSSKRSE